MDTISNLLVADCVMENSSIKTEEENKTSDSKACFRLKEIKWITEEQYKNKIVSQNAIDATIPLIETKRIKDNYILCDGKKYKREMFLKAMFPDYKKYPYKVKFKSDDVFHLGSSRRNWLQYHILAQKFGLVSVSKEDEEELKFFCGTSQETTAQDWLKRMNWKNGLAKIISFGVAIDVRGKNKGVWCYTEEITETSAIYKGVEMEWKAWLHNIKTWLDKLRKNKLEKKDINSIKNNLEFSNVFYQNGIYLTVTQREYDALNEWIEKYIRNGKEPFPFTGKIPNSDLQFTIDFENDVEIVQALNLQEPEQMAEHNKEHNKEIGHKKNYETFKRLIGDTWTRQEILTQGFNQCNLDNFVKYGFIKRVKRNCYMRVTE